MAFVPGQRWISNAEPELGLGTVLRAEGRSVQVLFAKAGVLRQYASHSARWRAPNFAPGRRSAATAWPSPSSAWNTATACCTTTARA